jgi:hypothetical protein
MHRLTRIEPAGPVQAYKTYAIAAPPDRLVVTACEDAGCLAWRYGWETVLNESTDLGRAQAAYVRHQSGRTFTESRTGAGLTVFRFESGQRCFAEHCTRPVTFAVRRGDWRGNLGLIRQFDRPDQFVEDFGEHQQRLADQLERG